MDCKTDSIHCWICYCKYDSQQVIPVVLPQCGHTLCKTCTQHVTKQGPKPICPFCKQPFLVFADKSFLQFKVNYAVLSLVEETHLFGRCKQHNVPFEYLCHTEKEYVCSDCCIFGDHAGHQIVKLNQAKADHEKQINRLEDKKSELDKLDYSIYNVQTLLNKREHEALKATDDYFDEVETLVKKKRQKAKSKITLEFAEEKAVFTRNVYRNQNNKSALAQKILKFKEISPEMLCNIHNEDVNKLFDTTEITTNIETYVSDLSQITEPLSFSLINDDHFKLEHIHFPNKTLLTQGLDENEGQSSFSCQSCLYLEVYKGNLIIKLRETAQNKDFESIFTEQKEFKTIHIHIETIDISENDLGLLNNIMYRCKQTQSMLIEFGIELSLNDKEKYERLMKVIFQNTIRLNSLHLDWNKESDCEVLRESLIKQTLPCLPVLESLEVNMSIGLTSSKKLSPDGSIALTKKDIKKLVERSLSFEI